MIGTIKASLFLIQHLSTSAISSTTNEFSALRTSKASLCQEALHPTHLMQIINAAKLNKSKEYIVSS